MRTMKRVEDDAMALATDSSTGDNAGEPLLVRDDSSTPPRSSDDPLEVSFDEASDLEARPFLNQDESSEAEKGSPHTTNGNRPTWKFLLGLFLLIVAVVTVCALIPVVFNLTSEQSEQKAQQEDHVNDLEDASQLQHDGESPGILQYNETIPASPQLRPASEYELSSGWDIYAAPVTREYFWTIQDGQLNPDGIYRPMMLINNQFPGPLVECNEGDRIIVHVENRAVNATSIHFHGLYQNGTNDMDGSVGITQCAIPPGHTFTYNFTITGQSGTYWYHAHHAVQASDGLVGPMVIHSKDEKTLQELEYASDRVIMVQDHYHNTTAELLMDYLRPRSENDEPVPDNALINGRGLRDCKDFPGWHCDTTDREIPEVTLAPGKRHRLRFINVGAFADFQIEIDQHEFHVTEVDGTDVHPKSFHRLNILPAQRYSIVVEANSTAADSFWMRTRMVTHCFTTENERLEPDLKVVIRYGSPDKDEPINAPTSTPWSEAIEVICRDLNTSALHPVVHITPPPADDFISLRANFMIGDWKLSRGFFNDSTWHANMTHPSLHRILDANLTPHSSGIKGIYTNTDPFDSTKDFVLQTTGIRTVDIAINSFDDGSHPFHLHGHKFFILAQARSGYPPSSASEVNAFLEKNSHVLENPLRRDVVTVEGYAWTLVRVVLDNPGLWAFHCHNSWHAAAGMVLQVLVRGDDAGFGRGVGEDQRRMCRQDGVTLGDRPDDCIWYGDFS